MTPAEPPILPYATPGDAGVPDFYPPVEEMLDRRCRPKDIRVHFRRASDAMAYFVRAMSRRFGVDAVGHVCEVCSRPCDTWAAMGWSVEMPKRKLELNMLESVPHGTFTTHHALCLACHRRWHRRMKRVNWTRFIACILLAVGIIWLLAVRSGYKGASLAVVLTPCVLMAVGVVMLAFANWIAGLATPRPIRRRLPPKIRANWLEALRQRGGAEL